MFVEALLLFYRMIALRYSDLSHPINVSPTNYICLT